ncbi:alpha/beta hydrolase [Rhodococcus sp. T2V]|uniref:alpha/beta hydrolase n=1 Tax=Rhodococcus sp. T2V TaxID=3034164 RepID=UPI0023E20178|nr:alpha/beta hydrolase [Rhodococcus sp. T2V]MDF3309530.1 alpha/beta hydrolase [Rhodococcus sp. T2V]
MALDKATAEFVQKMAKRGRCPVWEMTPVEVRQLGGALKEMYGAGPDMARIDDVTIESSAGGNFRARWLVPCPDPSAIVVYLHGGGWVTGNIDEYDTLGRQLAQASGATVLLVDYRKAPEHPFPTAVEDAWSALKWASRNQNEISGGRTLPLIIAGDSAGGNLAAVCAIRSVRDPDVSVALQVLVYPVTDSNFDTDSFTAPENQLMLSRPGMMWFWNHYIGDVGKRQHPEASPLRAPSLAGVAPALVLTAEHDPLRDEGEAYARRLSESGVEVDLRRFDGQMHAGFRQSRDNLVLTGGFVCG